MKDIIPQVTRHWAWEAYTVTHVSPILTIKGTSSYVSFFYKTYKKSIPK